MSQQGTKRVRGTRIVRACKAPMVPSTSWTQIGLKKSCAAAILFERQIRGLKEGRGYIPTGTVWIVRVPSIKEHPHSFVGYTGKSISSQESPEVS